jgi:hypothetical protein
MTLSHGASSCFCPLLVSTPSIFSLFNPSPPFPSPALSNIGNGMAQAFDMKDASVNQKKPLKMLTHV